MTGGARSIGALTRRKIAYAASLLGAFAAAIAFVWIATGGDPHPWHLALVALSCLVPGRICGWLWREVYRSRREIAHGRFEAGEAAASRALEAFDARPWLVHARWLAGMVHTRDPKAMVLNNRAVARAALGDRSGAIADLQRAVGRDPTYALAYANLAGLLDDPQAAREHRTRAHDLGLRDDQIEAALDRMAALLAEIEGRPRAAGGERPPRSP